MKEIFIWYHPEKDVYEKGTRYEYQRALMSQPDLDLIYELSEVSARLVGRVMEQLNLTRQEMWARAS